MEMKKIYNLTEKMNDDELKLFFSLMEKPLSKSEIRQIKNNYAVKDMKMKTLNESDLSENHHWIKYLYEDEIDELLVIINDNKLIHEIKGLKIFLFGPTGTGKSSFFNYLQEKTPAIETKNIEWERIIDPKMGQTQINLLSLSQELNKINQKTFIFLDELDSFSTNRNGPNDLGEYSRIVGSFIKFIDSLNQNIIFIAATNLVDKIDPAIVRRFNVKISSSYLDLNSFFKILSDEKINFDLSSQEEKMLISLVVDNNFSFSELENFIFKFKLATKLKKIKHLWVFTIKTLPSHFQNMDAIQQLVSERRKREMKEEGVMNESN